MTECLWCGSQFTPRASGKPMRFCSATCRRSTEHFARAYGMAEIEAGRVPIPARPRAPPATPALAGNGQPTDPAPDSPKPEQPPTEAPMSLIEAPQIQPTAPNGLRSDEEIVASLSQMILSPLKKTRDERDTLIAERADWEQERLELQDNYRLMQDSYQSEIDILKREVQSLQDRLKDREYEVHRLETEQTLWTQERERFVTLSGINFDNAQKMDDAIKSVAVDAIARKHAAEQPNGKHEVRLPEFLDRTKR